MKISRKAYLYIEDSIKKWEKIVATGEDGRGCSDCGLCKLFNHYSKAETAPAHPEDSCLKCPVYRETRRTYCRGTSFKYYEVSMNEGNYDMATIFAAEFLLYLRSLHSRCEVLP